MDHKTSLKLVALSTYEQEVCITQRTNGDMKLLVIKTPAEFSKIKEEWNELLEHTDSDSLFLRHEWLSNWWRCYGKNNELFILLLREQDVLVGAAPLMLGKSRVRGFPVWRISFAGDSAWTVGDFLARDGREEITQFFLEYLMTQSWDVIELRNIPQESRNNCIIDQFLDQKAIKHTHKYSANSPFVNAAESWDVFYRSKSGKFKKVLRNKLNRISKAGNIATTKYSEPGAVHVILPTIFEIALKGWKHRIGNAISSTEENRTFYGLLSEEMSRLGGIEVWLLNLDDKPIAFEYHVRYKNRIYGLVADYDETYGDFSPGSVLDYHIMKYIHEHERCEYDMGSGESFYKMNWTDRVKKHRKITIYNKSLIGEMLFFSETKIVQCLKGIHNKLKDARRILMDQK